ncbi:MAG: DUF1634 domain-containing protein [Candidatus Thorarchaeota archaeon]
MSSQNQDTFIKPAFYAVEQQFEEIISYLLRIGVIFSGFFMLLGMILAGLQGSTVDIENLSLNIIIENILQITPIGLIFIGIIILLLTPVMRVAISIILYIYIKDKKFAVVTSIVLLFMLIGILIGAE